MKPRYAQEDHAHAAAAAVPSLLPVDTDYGMHSYWRAGVSAYASCNVDFTEVGTMAWNSPAATTGGAGWAPLSNLPYRSANWAAGNAAGFWPNTGNWLNRWTGFRTRFWFCAAPGSTSFVGLYAGDGTPFTMTSHSSITDPFMGLFWGSAGTIKPASRSTGSASLGTALDDNTFGGVLCELQIDGAGGANPTWRFIQSDRSTAGVPIEQSGSFPTSMPDGYNFQPLIITGGSEVILVGYEQLVYFKTDEFGG